MLKSQYLCTLLIPLLLFALSLQAQNNTIGRTYQGQLPHSLDLDIKALRTHIYNGLPKDVNMANFDRQILRFADMNAVSIAALMKSGDIYSDWPEMDRYLNEVLQLVIPKALKKEKMIKAYLVKNGEFNAYMSVSGHMFINVGVFGMIEDEATLAGLMAHEIGHYYLKHGFETFVNNQNKAFELRMAYKKIDYFNFSVNNELDCDSLSLIWLDKAGYNPNGAIKTMQILEQLEQNQIMKYKDVWEIEKSTHPRGEKRVNKLQQFLSQMTTRPMPDFIVGKDQFKKLQKEAKTEIAKHLLHDFKYTKCIETAFRFHLEEPQNTDYHYFLMEGIRRAGLLDNSHWNKKFITHQYYAVIGDKEKKVKIGKHLFEDFFYDILLISKPKFQNLPTKSYWEEEPKFITNEQAFEYFARVGESLNEPECIFSNALSVSFDHEKCQSLLRKYLEHDNIRFHDFALEMINGTLRSNLPNNAIAILNNFTPVVKQGDEMVYIRDEEAKSSNSFLRQQFAPTFATYSKFIYLPELVDNQLNDYAILCNMAKFSRGKLSTIDQQINPYLLDPRFWGIMKKYKANELDFVWLDFRDVERNIQTLESYQNIINYNPKSYVEEAKRDRYLIIGIFSMRFKHSNIHKIVHYTHQKNLNFKKSVFPQLNNYIKRELEFKAKKANELD